MNDINNTVEVPQTESVSIQPDYQNLAHTFMEESRIQRERADNAELSLKALDAEIDGLRSFIRSIVQAELSLLSNVIDYEDLAQYINYRELGYEIDYSEVAYNIDNDEVAERICIDSLADNLSNRIEVTFKG